MKPILWILFCLNFKMIYLEYAHANVLLLTCHWLVSMRFQSHPHLAHCKRFQDTKAQFDVTVAMSIFCAVIWMMFLNWTRYFGFYLKTKVSGLCGVVVNTYMPKIPGWRHMSSLKRSQVNALQVLVKDQINGIIASGKPPLSTVVTPWEISELLKISYCSLWTEISVLTWKYFHFLCMSFPIWSWILFKVALRRCFIKTHI